MAKILMSYLVTWLTLIISHDGSALLSLVVAMFLTCWLTGGATASPPPPDQCKIAHRDDSDPNSKAKDVIC